MAPALSAARCLCHVQICLHGVTDSKLVHRLEKKREKKVSAAGEKQSVGGETWFICRLSPWLLVANAATAARSSHTSCQAPTACGKCGGAAHQEDSTAKTKKSIMTSPQGRWTLIRIWRLFALSSWDVTSRKLRSEAAEVWLARRNVHMFVKRSLNPAYVYLVNGW